MVETFAALWSQTVSTTDDQAALDMRYRFLRVDVKGQQVMFALAFLDSDMAGEIETWYSAQRQVIKIQNGRVIGTAGLDVDWNNVRYPVAPPKWDVALPSAASYVRDRDQMPGYEYGKRDVMRVTPLSSIPENRIPQTIPRTVAEGYKWFEETGRTSDGEPLPAELFAWGTHRGLNTIVYSEQCLAPTYCLKLQRWPVLP